VIEGAEYTDCIEPNSWLRWWGKAGPGGITLSAAWCPKADATIQRRLPQNNNVTSPAKITPFSMKQRFPSKNDPSEEKAGRCGPPLGKPISRSASSAAIATTPISAGPAPSSLMHQGDEGKGQRKKALKGQISLEKSQPRMVFLLTAEKTDPAFPQGK